MKSTKLTIAVTTIVLTLATHTAFAAGNPFKSLFPSQKRPTPMVRNPFAQPTNQNKKFLGLPTPGQLVDKAEKQTRKGWQDVKKTFGKTLNPFPKQKPKVRKVSWVDRLFPKKPVDPGPATMGEFLNMKRPGF